MMKLVMVGLALGASAAASANVASIDHVTRVEHRSGPVDARYRGDVVVRHKQTGSVAPGGRQSTLSCTWAADVTVTREARTATGAVMTRNFVRKDVAGGTRPGWCSTHRAAVAKQVASLANDAEGLKQQMAMEDHEVLRAEIDRHHGERAG